MSEQDVSTAIVTLTSDFSKPVSRVRCKGPTMNTPAAREAIHQDWLRPDSVRSTPWRLVPRVDVARRGLTDKLTGPLEKAPIDARPYSDDAARTMPWVLPPEPRDADEASQQINDYFDAVAAAMRSLQERNVGT